MLTIDVHYYVNLVPFPYDGTLVCTRSTPAELGINCFVNKRAMCSD